MEQTVNTFSKGLLMDTHPMTQGTDTLTDALNATLVTMNGNEIVLLNDMGNRRVDNAFLPSGFLPVGMKEYGGIIYIASYNPITGKSLIGSFPSPERIISDSDTKELGGLFSFKEFKDVITGTNFIKNDVYLASLTDDKSLHVGDKFVICDAGLFDSYDKITKDDITHYKQTTDINPFKNRLITLLVGILNSRNEFVDITESLVRWENNSMVSKDGLTFDEWFNTGYFIKQTKYASQTDWIGTLDDDQLIKERQLAKLDGNTYAYKLIGPLYLKAILNHVYSVNYTMVGWPVNNNNSTTYTIEITADITYNCPDDNERWFVLTKGLSSDEPSTIKKESYYDELQQMWKCSVTKTYTGITGDDNKTWSYALDIPAFYGKENADDLKELYLQGLHLEGEIDLNMFGSGQATVTGYRFYNNFEEKTGIITIAIDAYPEFGKSFSGLELEFLSGEDSNELYYLNFVNTFAYGVYTKEFSWKDVTDSNGNAAELTPQTLYNVKLRYNNCNSLQQCILMNFELTYFYLTTELFNSCYLLSSQDFVPNYIIFEHTATVPSLYQSIKNKKLKIQYDVETKFSDNSSYGNDEQTGQLISNDNQNIDLTYIHKYNVDLDNVTTAKITNPLLYPKHLLLQNLDISLENLSLIITNNQNDIVLYKNDEDSFRQNLVNNSLALSSNKVSGTIVYKDHYKCTATKHTYDILDGYVNIKKALEELINNNILKQNYTGLIPAYCSRTHGVTNHHYVMCPIDEVNPTASPITVANVDKLLEVGDIYVCKDGDNELKYIIIASLRADNDITFSAKELTKKLYETFNNTTTFSYILTGNFDEGKGFDITNGIYNTKPGRNDYTGVKNKSSLYCRVWWKGKNDTIATFKDLYYQSNSFLNYLCEHFPPTLYFCLYKLVQKELYGPTTTNNTENFNREYVLDTQLNMKTELTNLDFIKGNNDKILIFNGTDTLNLRDINYKLSSLESSETFLDTMNTRTDRSLKNVDLDTLIGVDNEESELKPRTLYEKIDGKLILSSFNDTAIVDEINGNSSYRTILYNGTKNNSSSPDWVYDTLVDYNNNNNDSTVHIKYYEIPVITKY